MDIVKFASQNPTVKEVLGNNTDRFIRSLATIVNSNKDLQDCTQESLLNAAFQAASLSLEIHPSIGQAYIIAFNERQKDGSFVKKAQLQIGYKGLIQLALRSNQVLRLSVSAICENQIVRTDELMGHKFDMQKKGDVIVGYAAMIRLSNGFVKIIYKTIEEIKTHAAKYSKTYSFSSSIWQKDFDAMARKTVLKALISTYCPLTTDVSDALYQDVVIEEEETPKEPEKQRFSDGYKIETLGNALKKGTTKWENYKDVFIFSESEMEYLKPILNQLGYE